MQCFVPLMATIMLHLSYFTVTARVYSPPIVIRASSYVLENFGPQPEVLRVQPHKSELIRQSWYEVIALGTYGSLMP